MSCACWVVRTGTGEVVATNLSVRKIRVAAPSLTRELTTLIAQVFTDHPLERDAK